jgi:GNAT superfamily N-acetyltransferase
MTTETSLAVIRRQDRADDDAVLSIFRTNYPQFPHGSTADYRFSVETWDKHGRTNRQWVAERSGAIAGCALLLEIMSTEPHLFWTEIQVLPDHRRLGIGSSLFRTVLGTAENLGGRKLLSEVLDCDDDGKKFIERHGFRPNGGHGEQLSRLDVQAANLDGFTGAERDLIENGLRVERLADLDLQNPAFIETLYRLDMDSHRDVPSPVEWSDMPFDEWLEVIVNGPGRSPEWAWVALDGDVPVGTSRLRVYDGGEAGNAYTRVRSEYRGRGIARALKYRTVAWCRENEIRFIYTGNSVSNQRMLAINRSLGYEPLPRTIEVVREIS